MSHQMWALLFWASIMLFAAWCRLTVRLSELDEDPVLRAERRARERAGFAEMVRWPS